jgi:hypothetical protein
MYVPGFSPHLQETFGLAPQQAFQPVSAPATASTPSAGRLAPREDVAPTAPLQTGSPVNLIGSHGAIDANVINRIRQSGQATPVSFGDGEGMLFFDNRNVIAGMPTATPTSNFQLVDRRTGQVAASGTGMDGLSQIWHTAQGLSSQGRKADWELFDVDPATGARKSVAVETPEKSFLGQLADIALPVAGAFLLPGVGGVLGGALGAGLGAAGGSAISSVAQGRSLGDTLTRAALSGGLAGLGAGVVGPAISGKGGALSGAATGATGSAGASAAGTGLSGAIANSASQFIPQIVVTGGAGGLGGALGGAAGAGLGAVGGAVASASSPNDIVVSGTRAPAPNTGFGAPFASAIPGILPQGVADMVAQSAAEAQQPQTPEGEPITVTGQPQSSIMDMIAPGLAISGPAAVAALGLGSGASAKSPVQKALSAVGNAAPALGLLSEALGGAGGGNRGALGTIPGGLGSGQLDPVFGSQLPAPSMPGLQGGMSSLTPSQMGNIDWSRYGYGPELSFFNYTQPQQGLPFTGPERDKDMMLAPGPVHFAEGGGAFAVRGPGTGRSDEIPALLSDGEYVIDAETVALLGDGSSEAGAERLDQMRMAVRKHKGQQLAKGNFSPDAKAPEHYLRGGRA